MSTGELEVDFRFQPHAKQVQWIRPYAREKLFGGAKRGGKSAALAMHIALLCVKYPGNRGLLARKNMTDLMDSTLHEFFQIVPQELYVHKRGDRAIRFHNGSECLYRGLGEEGEFEKAKSVTIGFLALDEPSEIPEPAFRQLNAQLTHVLPDGTRPPYMSILACNPEPGWVKQRYVDQISPEHLYVQSLPRENPGLPPGWEEELRSTNDPDWVRRYLDGSWDVFEGQVFTEFSPRHHDLDQFTQGWGANDYAHWREGLKFFACIDHATTGITTLQILGIDPDSNFFGLAEYYQSNRLISQHATDMQELLGKFQPIQGLLIDPSTAAKTQQGPYDLFSYLDEYRRNGIQARPAPRAAIEVGINLLKEYFHVNPNHRHPFTGELGSPRYFIARSKCPHKWKEYVELRKELLPAGGVRYLGADHGIDCDRYMVMDRPQPPKIPDTRVSKLPTLDQVKVRSHTQWQQQFAQATRPKNTNW